MKLLRTFVILIVLLTTNVYAAVTTNPEALPLVDGELTLGLRKPLSNPTVRSNIGPPFSVRHEALIEWKIKLHLNGRTGVKALVKINYEFQMRDNATGSVNVVGGSRTLEEMNDSRLSLDSFENVGVPVFLHPNTPTNGTSFTSLLVGSATLVSSVPSGVACSVVAGPGVPSDRANWTLASP